MDTTEIILLTALVNIIITGLISGIAVYRIQRKIDDGFQRSAFEHQTKFAINHAKTVETLQTLYKKLSDYYESFDYLIHRSADYCNSISKENLTKADCEKAWGKLVDFRTYYWNNRLFLSDEIADKLLQIYNWIRFVHEEVDENLTAERWARIESGRDVFEFIKHDLSHYERFTNRYPSGDWDSLAYSDILSLLRNYVFEQVRAVENIYKSVAMSQEAISQKSI